MSANITDPAASAAAGICVIARMAPAPARFSKHGVLLEPALRAVNTSQLHPRDCLWCPYPAKELNDWIAEFWRTVDCRSVEAFERLSRTVQRAKVHEAQYGDET